ncbi:hypothetical protein DFH29DRAFT_877741 [Suillus ampliporus]|nr:hypothetical protein DFH29DRAFT_877741 [Suillus ampliporus]
MSDTTALYVDTGIQASKIFDYCITLEAESQWVWHRKWTLVRFMFTISRYLPFFGNGMTFTAALRTQYYPGESCVRFGQASTGRRRIVNNEDLRFLALHVVLDFRDCGSHGVQRIWANVFSMILTLYQVTSSFGVILTMALPITWVSITDDPQVVIHSILASRLLFNLRESEERSRTRPTLVEGWFYRGLMDDGGFAVVTRPSKD